MKSTIRKLLGKAGSAMLREGLDTALLERTGHLTRQNQILLAQSYRQGEALSFDDVGFNTYSATGEDGILLYIFALIGFRHRTCVDLGSGQVYGSNVANLIVNHGFHGLLIDGGSYEMEVNRRFYAAHPETRLFQPVLLEKMITAENVNDLVRQQGFEGEIDLLSLDLDGVDYWILKAADAIRPRVVVVEYADLLGPDRSWTVPYSPTFDMKSFPVNADGFNYCSASLRAFTKLLVSRGYRLVGCARGGWNAFFVRNEEGMDVLPEVSVESCFRYPNNRRSAEERFPLVQDMPWEEV